MGDEMDTPRRIQRKRTKGWRMPPNTVSVCRPGKFGNPFVVGKTMLLGMSWICPKDNESAVEMFRKYIEKQFELYPDYTKEKLHELRGKNLACWCKEGEPCHGDVLLEMANR